MSVRYLLLFWLLAVSVQAQKPVPPVMLPDPAPRLEQYRATLAQLRHDRPVRDLPDLRFFLFGMGNRTKLIYRNGRLINAFTGHIEEQWNVRQEIIVPPDYLVHLMLDNGHTVQIREDEAGVWIIESSRKARRVANTKAPVRLPTFADRRFGPVLRVLHQEILLNIIGGITKSYGPPRPVPSLMVYQKPAYRSAAMMAMVLQQTGNVSLIRDWIMGLRSPFDRPDGVHTEADNLGQVLYLVSLVADKNHPVVATVLDSARTLRKNGGISGLTDGAEHSIYQTKWLKYGLSALALPDPYVIPQQADSYASVFWLDYRDKTAPGPGFGATISRQYPYLSWADDHFRVLSGNVVNRGMVGNLDYPLSWEENAPTAHYPGLTVLDKQLVGQKLAFPHGWHAAELFLVLGE